MTVKQISSTDLKNMDRMEYAKLVKDYAVKQGYKIPNDNLISFFHNNGLYINIAFDIFKKDIGINTSTT